MAEERVQRRLAAILAADVVGYSRLIEADEEGTRARLTDLLTKLIEPRIANDGGRIVKTIGDGILVEFPSAVDAVRSALAVQSGVTDHNTNLPDRQQLVFRIGINVGDVIIEGDDIHGDGVNVAARLEGLCQPGEVYISGTVHDHVAGKLYARFEDLGDQSVKNITRPVRAFRAVAASEVNEPEPVVGPEVHRDPDTPAIAVLPFENVSGDADQTYFADGITEDIITELSRFPELMVISRNSTFTYKGKVAKVQDVCKDLGAGYVVEGRVRKVGNRVRINAQLIDGRTGGHLWAERYDRELEDIFAVQDDVTEKIVEALEINLVRGGTPPDMRNRLHDTEAYDCVLRGREQYRLFTGESNAAARDLYQRAIDLDPDYAEPYAGLAETYVQDWLTGTESTLDRAFELAQKAAARDATLPLVHEALSTVHLFQGRHKEAMETAARWIELEPSNADAYATLAGAMHFAGENEEVIGLIEKAMSLNPLYPFFYPHYMGLANMGLRRYEEAIAALKRAADRSPEALWPHVFLASCLGHLQKHDQAFAELAEVRRISPDFSIGSVKKLLPYKISDDFDGLVDGLQKAGLSDKPE